MDAQQPSPSSSRPADYSRSRHRASSHNSAHADALSLGKLSDLPDSPLICREEAELIETDQQLARLIDELRAVGSFAYDSEFIGEMTYIPKLCLIQVASVKQVALIDPLAGIDLIPFWELLCEPAVEKIAHAAQQDIEPVIRNIGKPPVNLVDTQIASGFVGLAYPVSLSKLVKELVGVKLGKGLTFTHWDQRPLSAMQLRYAADDVRYLPAAWDAIRRRLEAAGHTCGEHTCGGHIAWNRQECDALCDPSQYGFNPETQYLRVRGATSLQPQALAVLRELVAWRDGAARAHDLPPRAFLKDEILVDLARSPVKSIEKLNRVRGLPKPIEVAHGKAIVEGTLAALALPAKKLPVPRQTEESPTERFAADALWAAAQVICSGRGIDPALVTSRQEVGEFYALLGKGGEIEHHLLQGWRKEALGQALIELHAGQARLQVEWRQKTPRATVERVEGAGK